VSEMVAEGNVTSVLWRDYTVGVGMAKDGSSVLVFTSPDGSESHTFVLSDDTRRVIVENLSRGVLLP
jgi:hypothetical protein